MPAQYETRILAFVCLGTEAGWSLVTYTPLGMDDVSSTGFVDTMKHELAHKLIHIQCGPPVTQWDEQYGEGVTNSYAVLFLGADPAQLSTQDDYAMNETTDAKARAIHENDLACFDGDVLPAP